MHLRQGKAGMLTQGTWLPAGQGVHSSSLVCPHHAESAGMSPWVGRSCWAADGLLRWLEQRRLPEVMVGASYAAMSPQTPNKHSKLIVLATSRAIHDALTRPAP